MMRSCLVALICAFTFFGPFMQSHVLAADDYVIGDGDGLSISVWGVPDLSVSASVRPDGKITLPAVGDVSATGLTPVELSHELTKVLDSYVKKPIVTVTVAGVTNNKIYIFGGGIPSRVMNLSGRTTLFKLLCSLPGVENVDFKSAHLMRNGEKHNIDIYSLFIDGDLSKDIKIQAEDILFLPTNEKNKIYVVGAINQPKQIVYREGLRILDAILECGGFSKFAKESAVLILRKEGGEDTRIMVNVEDLINDGDLSQNIELVRGDYVMVQEGIF